MMNIVKTLLLGLFCLIVFLIWTFPYARLGPKVKSVIENGLKATLGMPAHCELRGFDFKFPLGIEWSSLECRDQTDQMIVSTDQSDLSVLPGRQVADIKMGKGSLHLKLNSGIKSPPSRVDFDAKQIPMAEASPLLVTIGSRINPNTPRGLKLEGNLGGMADFPLQNFAHQNGKIDLHIDQLKIPQQSLLDLLGLKEVKFTKANLRVSLNNGKLTFSDVSFISDELSAKVEGDMQIQDRIQNSTPNILLKWKVVKSDALMSSPVGAALAAAPCPSPDSEGFCTKRVTRMSDFNIGM